MPQFYRTLFTLAVLALFSAAGAAAEEAPIPQRPQDVMEQAIGSMAAQIKNASMRFENNMVGMSRDARTSPTGSEEGDLSAGGRIGEGGKPESAPGSGKAAACCSRNVQQMIVELRTFEAVLAEYARRLDGNAEAMAKIMTMRRLRKEIEGGVTVFNATESRDIARSGLGVAAASLADLDKVHDGLLECCVNGSRKNQQ